MTKHLGEVLLHQDHATPRQIWQAMTQQLGGCSSCISHYHAWQVCQFTRTNNSWALRAPVKEVVRSRSTACVQLTGYLISSGLQVPMNDAVNMTTPTQHAAHLSTYRAQNLEAIMQSLPCQLLCMTPTSQHLLSFATATPACPTG